ncbi:MAG: DUF3080 domain-containing protein [Wenzhouxiangella sp.]|nr:DUF3080 domain-containing protein [Wenzhouxiangella sp.]
MRVLIVALAAIGLVACNPFAQPDSMLDEYNQRLARVLNVEPQSTPVPTAPAFPRLRDRVLEIEPISLSMLDFLRLYGCELQFVVGERNSILGRVAHPLTRLDYERRFIIAAESCAEGLEREALAEQLTEAVAQKRASLPDAAWNAVWGSREIERHFARSRGALPVGLDRYQVSASALHAALLEHRIQALSNGELEHDLAILDDIYQRWLYDPLAGQALRSAILVATRLNDASDLIEQRLGERPLCRDGRANRQAEIMRNMFSAVYAAEVQPYLADVQRVRRDLLPPLLALARLRDSSPSDSFERYVLTVLDDSNENSHWQAFDQAIARHTRAWQRLLDQCGMRPGSGNGAQPREA